MPNLLSLDALTEMKKADYIKAFKNKAVWKKATAAIILTDYKLAGKKMTLAIPFKKQAEMKREMKRLKAEKLHMLKKTAGCTLKLQKGEDGLPLFDTSIVMGGVAPELLQTKASPLFGLIKVGLNVQTNKAPQEESSAPEVSSEETTDKPTKKALTAAQKEQIRTNLSKLKEHITKLKTQLKIA